MESKSELRIHPENRYSLVDDRLANREQTMERLKSQRRTGLAKLVYGQALSSIAMI